MITFKLFLIKKLVGAIVVFFFGIPFLFAQSKAHEYSKFAIIDPAYSSNSILPETSILENTTSWIYGPTELECWRLLLLQQRKDSAELNVGYPGTFHKPYTEGSFRLTLKYPHFLNEIRFRVVGRGKVFINDELAGSFTEKDSFQNIKLEEKTKIDQIRFDINTLNEPPALLMEDKVFSTSRNNWEWKSKSEEWEPGYHFPQNLKKIPPHKLEDPTVAIKPVNSKNNLYDFGRELYGFLFIRSLEKPVISVGESEKEALDRNTNELEQSLELVSTAGGFWKTKSPLAFRYLYLENRVKEDITLHAIFHASTYKGAFACSDSTLTQIWMNSAYTLRLCMHDFLLDGIKRDRLPWAGDLAMSLLVDAYTFSDPELVRRSLVALGRAGIKQKDINGIIDYSLWWIISQDQYQLYFDDPSHLSYEWDRIREALKDLSSRCDANGFLIPQEENWLFIDWVDQDKWTALQILWWWAQNSGVKLAHRMGDMETANCWTEKSKNLKANLVEVAWSEKKQIWLSKIDSSSMNTRHPNFLSIVSGLASDNQYAGIKALLDNSNVKPVGTPYMKGYEVMALAQLGNIDYLLNLVKDYWGGMLRKGATSFWEAYNPEVTDEEQFSFYERPYGKSLCHAWSAGPAAFLPSELFGLKPLADGWERFTIHPNLGYLEWASTCLPTKYGNIIVDIINNDIQISIPKGTVLEWNDKTFDGPCLLKEKL